MLVKEFESVARKKNYSQIKVGAEDAAINFYASLKAYQPILLSQYEKNSYLPEDFGMKILREGNHGEDFVELEVANPTLIELENLRKRCPKAHFQYIFVRELK